MEAASKKVVEVVELSSISDKDADSIAAWMAEAFYQHDIFPVLFTGRTYEEDPELHRLLFRAVVDRGIRCGSLLTTPDRKAFRVQFLPGQKSKILDCDWRSGNDAAWDRLLDELGGRTVVQAKLNDVMKPLVNETKRIYGEDEGLGLVRSAFFGVKPGCQGQGIGRAIHKRTVDKAQELGVPFFFCTNLTNLALYEKVGCKQVSRVIDGLPLLDGYPEGSDRAIFVECAQAESHVMAS